MAQKNDLDQLMAEFYEDMALALDNVCKKIQNLQLGGPQARNDISIALSGLWAVWLEKTPADERAKYFSMGVKNISDDLIEVRMREVNREKTI